MNPEISVEGQLVDNVMRKLENEFSERIFYKNDVNEASTVGILDKKNAEEERESIKKDIAKALLVSNQTQSIYFVVRSMIMTILLSNNLDKTRQTAYVEMPRTKSSKTFIVPSCQNMANVIIAPRIVIIMDLTTK